MFFKNERWGNSEAVSLDDQIPTWAMLPVYLRSNTQERGLMPIYDGFDTNVLAGMGASGSERFFSSSSSPYLTVRRVSITCIDCSSDHIVHLPR